MKNNQLRTCLNVVLLYDCCTEQFHFTSMLKIHSKPLICTLKEIQHMIRSTLCEKRTIFLVSSFNFITVIHIQDKVYTLLCVLSGLQCKWLSNISTSVHYGSVNGLRYSFMCVFRFSACFVSKTLNMNGKNSSGCVDVSVHETVPHNTCLLYRSTVTMCHKRVYLNWENQ